MSAIDRRSFIKRGSLFVPGILTGTSLLGFLQGCGSAPLLYTTRILGALGAAAAILDYLGLRPSYSNSVDHRESSQCKTYLQQDERNMRQYGMKVFVGVRRSPIDMDIAVMVGLQSVNQKSSGQASVQFKGNPSVQFHENEIDAVRAAAAFIKQHYKFSGRDLARAVAIKERNTVRVPDENSGLMASVTRFGDARGGYILYNRQPMGELSRFRGGTISVYQPDRTDKDNLPIVGLES